MADNITNLNNLGEDAIKGGIYFSSSLTPNGTFSNIPRYYTSVPNETEDATIVLTLDKIKQNLKQKLKEEYSYSDAELDNTLVESFLFEFVNLLIDYRDLRNYIFFGSAYTEIAYHIRDIIEQFPYKTLLADLASAFNDIVLVNHTSTKTTDIYFNETSIKDIGSFKFYDTDTKFNISDYEIEDKNGKRYPIIKFIAPYESNQIFDINAIVNGVDTLELTTVTNHNYLTGQTIELFEVDATTNLVINNKYIVTVIDSTTLELREAITNLPITETIIYNTGGKTRLYPLELNVRPYTFKITIEGLLTDNELIAYTDSLDADNLGLLLSPTLGLINKFYYYLHPIQRMLLAPLPINQTPWPRRIITGNIQNVADSQTQEIDVDFISWLQDPNMLYVKDGSEQDNDYAYSDVYNELNVLKALALDESVTNQIVRRCISENIITEVGDTSEGHFQRFLLMTGWFFDQIYLYIKFTKYIHHVDYKDFNQLSPEFYKYYADHFGFELFGDDDVDFSKLVIQTEPGLYYSSNSNNDLNNKYYRFTIQQLQYERQKRLLVSLFHLYKTKGTQSCIKQLVSLLGAPEGLLQVYEYAFKFSNVNNESYLIDNKKELIVDNEKVHVPEYHYEIDPNYLIDKTNINNQINKPYVYRIKLHNDHITNLRQIGITTDPNLAIDNHIKSVFGNQKNRYLKLANDEFCNLQNETDKFYLLPLTFPDKFFGFSLDYMIERNGYLKSTSNVGEESNINLCSLYLANSIGFKPVSNVANVVLNMLTSSATITLTAVHNYQAGDKVSINSIVGIDNINASFIIDAVPTNLTFKIIGNFDGTYTSGGQVKCITPNLLPSGHNLAYPVAIQYANYNYSALSSFDLNNYQDFNTISNYGGGYLNLPDSATYFIVRLEGNDLVIRANIYSEVNSNYVPLVSITKNIFSPDGLNHNIRILVRESGVEIYQDYDFKELSFWRDPFLNSEGIPFIPIEIPKHLISGCDATLFDMENIVARPTNDGADVTRWWDMLIGLPVNIDFLFKRIEVFENVGVDSYNIGDKINNGLNYNSDSYIFDFNYCSIDTDLKTSVNSIFKKQNPEYDGIDYSIIDLTTDVVNNVEFVKNLSMTSKSIIEASNKLIFNKKQNFFEFDDQFKNFAWSKNLKSRYDYENFNGKVNKLYQLYSQQVITYEVLYSFLELIEKKFRNTIKQFIPIVINISEFGRSLKNSDYNVPKYRYPNIYKECVVGECARPSNVQLKLFEYDEQSNVLLDSSSGDYTIEIIKPDTTSLFGVIHVAGQIYIPNTLNEMVTQFNDSINNPYYPYVKASVISNIFRVEIDYDWFTTTFGADANLCEIEIQDGDGVLNRQFSSGQSEIQSECSSICYALPKSDKIEQVYIFYNSEIEDNPYLYYDIEDEINPIIKYDSE